MAPAKPEENMLVPEHGFSLFLAPRTRLIHFIRHAEGYHNQAIREAGSEAPTIYSTPGSEKYEDARLNDKGRQQCVDVRENVIFKRIPEIKPDLIVVSPLTRTLETAYLLFADGDQKHKTPFLVHDLCRERWGKYTNDRRRKASEIIGEFKPLFEKAGAEIDFTTYAYATEEDEQWTKERESDESCSGRAIEFLKWLTRRKEKEIAVVTHSSFLRHLFGEFGSNLSTADRTTLQRSAGNAEVRSVVLACHRGQCG